MIILLATTDKIQVVNDAAGSLDMLSNYVDSNVSPPLSVQAFGRNPVNNVTTATTTDLVTGAASTARTPSTMFIKNTHASVVQNITVRYQLTGPVNVQLYTTTLLPGETLLWSKELGFYKPTVGTKQLFNCSTADQTTSAGTDTYLTGSNLVIPTNRPIGIGTTFRWRVYGSKSAAGTAAWTVNVRFGTAGSTSDTARLALAQVTQVQTAVADNGVWEVTCTVRGPISSSCIVSGGLLFTHHLATTGLSTVGIADAYQQTSSAFDITTVTQVGLSINPGASGVFTFQNVVAEALSI